MGVNSATVSDLLLDTLSLMGVRYIFGNPGTTEIPLVTSCWGDSRPTYVVGLSEISCVAMADGYARVRNSLGVVNLHVAPGLGNAMGSLYTASQVNTPLLVIIGAQDRRHIASGPILDGPLDALARSLAKAVFTIDDPTQASLLIRRAIRTAIALPSGPVALICPMDVMDQPIYDRAVPVTVPRLGSISARDVSEVTSIVSQSTEPAIIVSEDVYWCSAGSEVLDLAEILQAPLYVAPYTGILPIDAASPFMFGFLPPSRALWSSRLKDYDCLIFLGGKGLRPTLYSQGSLPQPKIWIGTNANVMGSDGEFQFCAVADLRQSLNVINSAFRRSYSARFTGKSRSELTTASLDPMHPSRIVDYILSTNPEALIIDESGLSTTDVKAIFRGPAGTYLTNGSGGIGWGAPALVGALFADSGRSVLGLIGDGAIPYAAEALWTATKSKKTGGRLVVFNNQQYATLNLALRKLTNTLEHDTFDLSGSRISFEGIATAYGWAYLQVKSHDDLVDALNISDDDLSRNWLIEICLDPSLVPLTALDHF